MTKAKKVLDFFLVDLLWLLCSIPVITMGAATTASFYVNLKLSSGQEISVPKMFFKSFKENLLQGIGAFLISVVTMGLAGYFWYLMVSNDNCTAVYIILNVVFSFVVLNFNIVLYALISHFENTLKNTAKNAFAVSITYFVYTLKMTFFAALEIAAIVILFRFNLIAGCICLLFWPEVIFYTNIIFIKKVFTELENHNKDSAN